ncbi:hypothetical protein HPB48_010705 [Haemaphysalis longicornis]|uniref:RNase H type-1 domain-containing protein n=1 Tax=Haemaphysalis longicornis TaxID=44386 RepID=A0A9J6G9L1_HAELO|nr:hypothetical protein HPB48_010705 [Haemaphysalis longicornis]
MENLPTVTLLWVPAHATLEGNEEACALTNQTNLPVAFTDTPGNGGRLLKYWEILNYYREGRRSYPGPHQSLDRKQAVALRLLQTNSFPIPVLYHQMYPDLCDPKCKFC